MDSGDRHAARTSAPRKRLALAGVFAAAAVMLALWPQDWIEALTGAEPDGGSGSFEMIPVLVLAVVALVLAGSALRSRIAPAR